MTTEFNAAIKPVLDLVTEIFKIGAAERLEYSITTIQTMRNKLGGGGNAGPLGRPEEQARMRKLVKGEDAEGAEDIEHRLVAMRWEMVKEEIMAKLAR